LISFGKGNIHYEEGRERTRERYFVFFDYGILAWMPGRGC